MDYLEKAKIINSRFGVYGYGNFDVTVEELAHILELIKMNNPEDFIIDFYEQLEQKRMG